jgi:hypothetical protein
MTGALSLSAAIAIAVSTALAAAGPSAPASPSPAPAVAGRTTALPSPVPLDTTPRQVAISGAPSGSRDSTDAASLKGIQAIETRPGQARLRLSVGERTVRPGDRIGADVVRRIEPGRILLTRAQKDGGEATVVVTFDEGGRGRIRVYYGSDPAAAPPAVR